MLAALIGVDGSGKSTQLGRLAAIYAAKGLDVQTVALKAKPSLQAALDVAEALGEKPFELQPNATVNASVLANALACDFLRHYVSNILPLLRNRSKRTVVLTDRYAVCYAGYADALGAPQSGLYGTLDRMCIPPDVTLCFDIPYELVETRLASRAGPRAPDETPHILSRLVDYYRRMLTSEAPRFVRVPAELPEADVTAFLVSVIDGCSANE